MSANIGVLFVAAVDCCVWADASAAAVAVKKHVFFFPENTMLLPPSSTFIHQPISMQYATLGFGSVENHQSCVTRSPKGKLVHDTSVHLTQRGVCAR